MNQFAHFSVINNSTIQNDDAFYNKRESMETKENLEMNSLRTNLQTGNDKYSFYTSDSLNKQIFHVNEMIMSSGGNRGYFGLMA